MEQKNLITGRLYQDSNFVVTDFSDAFLEGLIGMEDLEDCEPLLIFIKIKDRNWNRFFLDGGNGFWENWQETEVDQSEAHIDEVFYVDYMEKYALNNKQIESIICKDAQITILFKDTSQFILKEVQPGHIESASEIRYIS